MEPSIKYAKTSDGVSIAYWTMGEGDRHLVWTPPWSFSHIGLELQDPLIRGWYEQLSEANTRVRYDIRAAGGTAIDTETRSVHNRRHSGPNCILTPLFDRDLGPRRGFSRLRCERGAGPASPSGSLLGRILG